MTDKLDVIYVKSSKHILAAITRNADPTGKIKIDDLARAGLLIRSFAAVSPTTGNERFEIPSKDLEVATVDLDLGILLRLRAYSFDDVGKKAILTPTAPIIASVTLSNVNIVVNVNAPVTKETPVRAQVE